MFCVIFASVTTSTVRKRRLFPQNPTLRSPMLWPKQFQILAYLSTHGRPPENWESAKRPYGLRPNPVDRFRWYVSESETFVIRE